MLLPLLLTLSAQAETIRHAVLVGANDGPASLEDLRYAEDDARRMAEVLVELGGFRADRVTVLYGPDAAELDAALADHAAVARASGDDLFLFYYSGHADPQGLRLGEETYTYSALRRMVRDIPSDVRIGVLDACRSGEITRIKGMELGAPFASDATRGLDAEGEAWITATAPGEAAQESEALRSSFFTHYLTSALRGAADTDDGVVSLGEAYAYAYDRTVARTTGTTGGTQHPAYDFRLQGRGDLGLTDVRRANATLILPEDMEGELTVLRVPDGIPVAEVSKRAGRSMRIAVQPGRYTLRLRDEDQVLEARAGVGDGGELVVRGLRPIEEAVALAKGEAAPIEDEARPADEAAPPAEAPEARAADVDRMLGGLNRKVGDAVARIDQRVSPVIAPITTALRARDEDAPPVAVLTVPESVTQGCTTSEILCLEARPDEAAMPDGPALLTWDGAGPAAEGQLAAGLREGRWVFWYPSGQRLAEGTYVAGKPSGTWTWWNAEGQRVRRGNYQEGRRSGLWTEWYDSGARRQQVVFDDDVADGRYTAWYPDGRLRREGHMDQGKPQGRWTFWHETGEKAARGAYEAGLKEGSWVTWFPDGRVATRGEYLAGLENGDFVTFWETGEPRAEGSYVQGVKEGVWRTWDEEGRLLSKGAYVSGVETGTWRIREDGQMKRVKLGT